MVVHLEGMWWRQSSQRNDKEMSKVHESNDHLLCGAPHAPLSSSIISACKNCVREGQARHIRKLTIVDGGATVVIVCLHAFDFECTRCKDVDELCVEVRSTIELYKPKTYDCRYQHSYGGRRSVFGARCHRASARSQARGLAGGLYENWSLIGQLKEEGLRRTFVDFENMVVVIEE